MERGIANGTSQELNVASRFSKDLSKRQDVLFPRCQTIKAKAEKTLWVEFSLI